MKCFKYNQSKSKECNKKKCRYWINSKNYQNCCLIASNLNHDNNEKFTLQDIGDIFKVTRMRICQIEKIAIRKIKDRLLNST